MNKYVVVVNSINVIDKLFINKIVEGLLFLDENTGRLSFKAYNRLPRIRQKDELVKKLPWGWVRESLERIKVFGSFPKDYGTVNIMGLLEEQMQDAKNALIERELGQ